jgi:hypothetical protein
VLFGSGETAAVGRDALRWLVASGRPPGSVAVLETPAGFEPNADAVAARWADFLGRQAEVHGAVFVQLAARRRGAPRGPDDPAIAGQVAGADLIVLGAGSPTYAARQLRSTVTWDTAIAAHLAGASFFLASAAAIAAGTRSLPVYEIYKVGEDLHWNDGLGLFELYGLRLAVVTHWDNTEGGAGLDTSRAYMGAARFRELLALLPGGITVVGIDEHTALCVDPRAATAQVVGRGGVTVLRDGARTFGAGSSFSLRELGPFSLPDAEAIVPAERARAIERVRSARAPSPPPEISALVRARERARAASDWETADRLRDQVTESGWSIEDAPEGPRLVPARRDPSWR